MGISISMYKKVWFSKSYHETTHFNNIITETIILTLDILGGESDSYKYYRKSLSIFSITNSNYPFA